MFWAEGHDEPLIRQEMIPVPQFAKNPMVPVVGDRGKYNGQGPRCYCEAGRTSAMRTGCRDVSTISTTTRTLNFFAAPHDMMANTTRA